MQATQALPLILAGPILRKATHNALVVWLVTSKPLVGHFTLVVDENDELIVNEPLSQFEQIKIGEHAWITLVQLEQELPTHVPLRYDFSTPDGLLRSLAPELLYSEEQSPCFNITDKADYVLHGSCRNPDHATKDALIAADKKVAQLPVAQRPDMLIMSGDQIYADHVSGPLLVAVHKIIDILGLHGEEFEESTLKTSDELYLHPDTLYGRYSILPTTHSSHGLFSRLISSGPKPTFTSQRCVNHLISLAEFIAMYLLVWSPELWRIISIDKPGDEAASAQVQKGLEQWDNEKSRLDKFVEGLPSSRRLLAHIPTYMIFDDHDVTDDWNLTVGWEKNINQSKLAKRIIGNGLISYWLCQGWGNEPNNFNKEFIQVAKSFFTEPSLQHHNAFVQYLNQFERWHYTIPTSPKVVVLDTRTRRWRSESKMNKPSGLMDWEALIEFQQELLNEEKVIIVSAAPMFGVKFIEALQRIMTWVGQPLIIDAENWMAHPGSANTLLSIFTHTKTPTNFVILSGDVHYSFAYDIKVRHSKSSPNIFQITCSGLKNEFPEPLLNICDRLDRLLYSPYSFLNLFTKRKRLLIKKRDPSTIGTRRLVNQSAIGELKLDVNGKPASIELLTSEGETVTFPERK
ncbi:alkaline phosphatase family protein [Vibrio sp. S4M6]|uniref:alkaline phosphatase D family protein n=1 Tax=Vibrio sinus TaxID=2946865 RepID=UPI00202A0D9F|nr:alkaline phosphatase D family protein [Vibrio sinus]MCL9781214.1 alkaline phosphatase family protein [Vibrio sinus]